MGEPFLNFYFLARRDLTFAAGSLHARCRRSIGPFVYSYQENGQGWEGFELWVGLRGDVPVIYAEDWGVCEICAPGCTVFRCFVEHQVGAVVVAVVGEVGGLGHHVVDSSLLQGW